MKPPLDRHSVAILGATGTIGRAALEVIDALGPPWRVFGVSAHRRIDELIRIARRCNPQWIAVADPESAGSATALEDGPWRVAAGGAALVDLACHPEVGTVVAAVVGAAGMMSTLAAAECGKRLALANKESLVVAGSLVTDAVARSGGELIPVDSEHSAIFQAMRSGAVHEVKRIVLTASGGPFRTWPKSKLVDATVADALAHPTWQMGRKITIDSATMMNKALEIIEARWLFNLSADQIDVVVHPQSILHSFVEFIDGSVIAQLSPPDMRLPIQYALTYPERKPCPCPKLDWSEALTLELEPVDRERFPALDLGWEVVRRGGSCGAVLNAANEVAVEAFLDGRIRFPDIVAACRAVLDSHDFEPKPSLEDLLRLDRWAREETLRWITAS